MSQSGVLISPTGLIFPKFTANLPVRRRSEYYTWNVFLVIIGVCIFGNFVYFIEPTAISDRLGFTVSIVFTQIALKYTISTRVPLIPYLSYLDKVMLISLLIAVLTAIENAVVCILLKNATTNIMIARLMDIFSGTVTVLICIFMMGHIIYKGYHNDSSNPTKFYDGDLVDSDNPLLVEGKNVEISISSMSNTNKTWHVQKIILSMIMLGGLIFLKEKEKYGGKE